MSQLGPSLKEKSGSQALKIPHSKENLPKLLFIKNEVRWMFHLKKYELTAFSTLSQRMQRSWSFAIPRTTPSLPMTSLLLELRMSTLPSMLPGKLLRHGERLLPQSVVTVCFDWQT